MRSRQRGFTLIELLVVIAVIALLMAILMPVLGKARKQGYDAVCRSNLRQIGFGAYMYADAWDLYMPRGAAGNKAWYMLFMGYLSQRPVGNDYRTVKIYRCPAYPNKEQTVCYVVNGWDFRDRTDSTGREITSHSRLSTCTRPSQTLYLVDNEDGSWRSIIRSATDDGVNRCDVWNPGHMPSSDSTDITYGRRVARARHRNSGCNGLWLDWHVEWIFWRDMTIDMWRWNR